MPKLHGVLALAFAVSVPIAPLPAQSTDSPAAAPDTVDRFVAGVARIYFSTSSGKP